MPCREPSTLEAVIQVSQFVLSSSYYLMSQMGSCLNVDRKLESYRAEYEQLREEVIPEQDGVTSHQEEVNPGQEKVQIKPQPEIYWFVVL